MLLRRETSRLTTGSFVEPVVLRVLPELEDQLVWQVVRADKDLGVADDVA
jgi:hypothetical protein